MQILDHVKVGDVLTFKGQGYLSNMIRKYRVNRITKKFIFCNDNTVKVALDGTMLPRDRFINHNVVAINGKAYDGSERHEND
jgi:hypothetical protein